MDFLRTHRSLFLFVAILFAMLTSPVLRVDGPTLPMLGLGLLWALLIGIGGYLISSSKGWLSVYSLAMSTVFASVLVEMVFGHYVANEAIRHSLTLLIHSSALYVSLRYAIGRSEGNALDRTVGGVCGYFLLGFAWSRLFALLHLFDPGTFSNGEMVLRLNESDLLYFSFVNLTTLGYGDIVPVSGLARILSALEAVFGTLYLAVMIASLVGELRMKSPSSA